MHLVAAAVSSAMGCARHLHQGFPYFATSRSDMRTVCKRLNASDWPLLAPQAISGGNTEKLFSTQQQVG
ncbi:hypothetical protein AB7M71_010445 [Bradyrhizobium japonicum]